MKDEVLRKVIRVAQGKEAADLLLKGASVINVLSGEIIEQDVAVAEGHVAGVGPGYRAECEMDLSGYYLAPGFIDGHVHIESSMMVIPQFARAVVPLGTTSVVTDSHEIANVLGYEGIRYMLESSKHNPLNVFIMLPSCVPSTSMETAGSALKAFDLYPFFSERWVLGLGEMMNYPGVLNAEEDVMDKIKITGNKRLDGHAPGLSGKELCAYVAAGIASEHECTSAAEALEKLRLGMHIMVREGTGARNLKELIGVITRENSRRTFFVTDDRHPHEILEEGHINSMVRRAVKDGLDPIIALQMASINAADYFGLRHLGAIAPGREADMVVLDSLEELQVLKVFKRGVLVAENGIPVYESPLPRAQPRVRSSVNIRWLQGDEFEIPARGDTCRVIQVVEDQLITREALRAAKVKDGRVVSDPERDILKIAVIERHRASGNIGKGLVEGFGLKRGALASSVAHDSHNIIVVGVDDRDMFRAVVQINKMGGGMAVAEDGRTIGALELPVAGLLSEEPLPVVVSKLEKVLGAARSLGSHLRDPFMTLSFLALPVIPKLKLTDMGLVDVDRFDFVDLFVKAA